MNGAFASLARRRAISVLPTPVGPIMMMFLGVISSTQIALNLLATPTVAKRDRDGTLGRLLAHDVAIQFAHQLSRRQGADLLVHETSLVM